MSGAVIPRYRAFGPPTSLRSRGRLTRIVQSAEKGRGRRRGRSCAKLPVARGDCYPPKVPRWADGGNYTLRDSGPGGGLILMFGREINIRSIAQYEGWGADGAFKVRPRLWSQIYTINAAVEGYFPHAPPPHPPPRQDKGNVYADVGRSQSADRVRIW